jgi:acyl-coenzyme A thioesterase PaaI-like protein
MAQWTKYLDFVTNIPPPAEDLSFFSSNPWLQPYFAITSLYRPVPFYARFDKGGTFDRFFNTIINTPDTVPYAIGLMRRDEHWKQQVKALSENQAVRDTSVSIGSECAQADFILLIHLREDVSGFESTAHGGFLGALFDEGMSACIETVRQVGTEQLGQLFTANLNVSFRAPVALPGTYMIALWLVRREGRKWFVEAKMVGKEGTVVAKAEALWISIKTESKV